MDNNKNLEELIAAIGDDPSLTTVSPTSFSSASGGVPIPVPSHPVNPVTAGAQRTTGQSTNRLSGGVRGNLDELVQYLGGNGTSAVNSSIATPPGRASHAPGYGVHNVPMMTAQQRVLSQPRIPNPRAAASDHKLSAADYRRQQLQNTKAAQKRNPAVRVGGHARTASAPSIPSAKTAAAPQQQMDITAELNAVMSKNGSSNVSRATSRPVSTGPRPSSGPPGAQPGAAPGRTQRPQITQEQIIVGHFCRHAIKTLAKAMQDHPLKQQTEVRLREHIKGLWAQWVRGIIPRQKLLESVASFVRNSCPQAMGIDVIREFKIWYEHEFELQKARTAAADRKTLQQQDLARQQRLQTAQAKLQQRKPQQARSAAQSQAGNANLQYPVQRVATGRPVNSTKAVGKEPQLVDSQFVKSEPQVQPVSRTAGKSIPRNSAQIRKTPVPKPSKGVAIKDGTVKHVAGKSVGGKSLTRPASASLAKGKVGVKGPTAAGPPRPATTGTGSAVEGKGVAGNKGLLANKLPAGLVNKLPPGPKPKAPRKALAKNPAKTSPSKSAMKVQPPKLVSKGSPRGLAGKQKPGPPGGPNSTLGAAASSTMPGSAKRPLDTNGAAAVGSLAKKAKSYPKGPKGNAAKKKAVSFPSTGEPGRSTKPPPARADLGKGRAPSSSATGSGIAGTAGGAVRPGTLSATPSSAAPGSQVRKAKRVGDELSLVNNVVDLDDEVDKLGRDAGGGSSEVIEIFDYDSDMLLAGPALRTKMQATAKRYGLNENISKDAMEIVSLAVHERLKSFLESLKGIAAVRVDAAKESWSTETFGISVCEKLERMREDEERSLTVAAELRVKRRKEQEEREAKKLAGEAEREEKKSKDASAAAEMERKEKIALEKKRKEHSSQRDALSGLLAGIDKKRKKPSTGKGLAGLAPLLPPITKSGGSAGSASLLPPIPKLAGSGGSDSLVHNGIVHLGKDGKQLNTLEKVKALGPLVKLGGPRTSSMPGAMSKKGAAAKTHPKLPLTLRDCLFLMESEQNTRKSSHLYKWYARLGPTQQAVKGK